MTSTVSSVSTSRLIRGPALLSLAVTLLRLAGELLHWSERWFSTATQGTTPSGTSWLIGISWLALPFGAYFAVKLAAAGVPTPSATRVLGAGILGVALWLAARAFLFPLVPLPFPRFLVVIWACMAAAAAIQWAGWPALARTLLAYGLAARVPVVVVMSLAMWWSWGTHYDYVGMPEPFQMPFWPRFLWLAFFPQLVFWVGFTIVVGAVGGGLGLAVRALVGVGRRVPAHS